MLQDTQCHPLPPPSHNTPSVPLSRTPRSPCFEWGSGWRTGSQPRTAPTPPPTPRAPPGARTRYMWVAGGQAGPCEYPPSLHRHSRHSPSLTPLHCCAARLYCCAMRRSRRAAASCATGASATATGPPLATPPPPTGESRGWGRVATIRPLFEAHHRRPYETSPTDTPPALLFCRATYHSSYDASALFSCPSPAK